VVFSEYLIVVEEVVYAGVLRMRNRIGGRRGRREEGATIHRTHLRNHKLIFRRSYLAILSVQYYRST
jgi:hypothetical protein